MAFGPTYTWKVVYHLKEIKFGVNTGVALVEAADRSDAMHSFRQLYAGQFHTIKSCEKLVK